MNHKHLYESPLAEIVEMTVESVVCGPTNVKGQMGGWRNTGNDPWGGTRVVPTAWAVGRTMARAHGINQNVKRKISDMKKRIIYIAASLAAVLASSCNKETDFRKEDGILQIPVTIHALYGEADTKVTYTENGAEITAKWDSGDKLLVVYDGQVSTLDLVSGAGSAYATFSGNIQCTTAPAANSILNCFIQDAKNPNALTVSGSSISFTDGIYTGQNGTVEGAAKCNVYSGMASYGDGNVNCSFSVNCAILKFTLVDIGAHNGNTAILAYKSGDNTLALASWTVLAGYNTVYLAVPAGNYSGEQTLQYSCDAMSASMSKVLSADHANFKPGATYSKSIVFLPQYFYSVSTTKQVRFSPGNLQYQPSTDTWRFGEHQWSFVGDGATTYQHGNVLEGGARSNNELIDVGYTGWIDLFGWGTWTGTGSEPGDVRPATQNTVSSFSRTDFRFRQRIPMISDGAPSMKPMVSPRIVLSMVGTSWRLPVAFSCLRQDIGKAQPFLAAPLVAIGPVLPRIVTKESPISCYSLRRTISPG